MLFKDFVHVKITFLFPVICPRSKLSWILASALLILFVLVTILFLYPSYDQRILIREEPIEVRIIPPTLEDAVDGENHPVCFCRNVIFFIEF